MQNTIELTLFQLQHYTKRLAETPTYLVTPTGEIVINPARRFIRQRLLTIKKQMQNDRTR